MNKLKFEGNSRSQVLFLNPKLEPTLPNLDKSNYLDYVRNYKNHVTWSTSDTMIDGSTNPNYRKNINDFKQFLINRKVKFNVVEKYNNGLKCNTVRFNISKDQIETQDY